MQNPDIPFIQMKLANIGTALFYCGNDCPLPFSTYIITALKIDENGFVWFFVNKGQQKQENSHSPFAAQLEFYRKGYPFSMKISGEASIAEPGDKMNDLMGKGINLSQEALSGILLVKVKIEDVLYRDLKEQNWMQPLQRATGWFKKLLQPTPAPANWNPAPAMS
ncbi:MAG: hypothetical protein QM726_08525 [Chitinophagaceae bacterium]